MSCHRQRDSGVQHFTVRERSVVDPRLPFDLGREENTSARANVDSDDGPVWELASVLIEG